MKVLISIIVFFSLVAPCYGETHKTEELTNEMIIEYAKAHNLSWKYASSGWGFINGEFITNRKRYIMIGEESDFINGQPFSSHWHTPAFIEEEREKILNWSQP